MADRRTARLFARLFWLIRTSYCSDLEKKRLARQIWILMREGDYDFSPRQLDCDETLLELGLAKIRKGEILYD